MLFPNYRVVNLGVRGHINHGLMKLGDPVGPDHIVLAQRQARRPQSSRAQPPSVLKSQEFLYLFLRRFLQKDFTKINHGGGMGGLDHITGQVGLCLREDGEWMNHSARMDVNTL